MLGKRLNAKVCHVKCRKSCVHEVLKQDEGEQVSRVLSDRKVREMRTADTILGLIDQRPQKAVNGAILESRVR
jgi:hypothetical protein